jgi:Putative regulator of cell autolysis
MKQGRTIRYIIGALSVLVITLIIAGIAIHVKSQPFTIKNGVLNLSSLKCDRYVVLSGEAEFYWKQLLAEKDFHENRKPDCLPVIPSVWNYYSLDGEAHPPGRGYATYRIHVTGVKPGRALAMRVQPFSSAYDLYIDDELMASCGKAGTTQAGTYPQYSIKTYEFTPEADQFDIIIHISNFIYARGGLWYPPAIGTPEQISGLNMKIFAGDVFMIGLFSLMLVYNVFYSILRRDRYLVLFIVMDILLICRTLILGSYLINYIFPSADFHVFIWMNYIPICLLPSVCLMLVYHYFRVKIPKPAVLISLGFSIPTAAAAVLMPIYSFTQFTYVILAAVLLISLYIIGKLGCALLGDKEGGSLDLLFMSLGIIAVILCAVRDILFNENLIKTGFTDTFSVGFMLLILFWDMSITYRYEALTKDRLRIIQELNASNERERLLELRFLKSQIRPHFINNALNTIISISRTEMDRARLLLVQFSKYLRGRYDFEDLDDIIPIVQELEYVRAYLALETARFGDKLHVEYNIDDVTLCVPPLVLQPLVENAVIHGVRGRPDGGHIMIYVKNDGFYIKIGVRDDGGGMTPESIHEVLYNKPGTSDGIALYNINSRMMKLYHTGLGIICPESGGLDVFVMIPRKGTEQNESSHN